MTQQNHKLWGGRFEDKPERWVDEFGASIQFDQVMAEQDITGSIAHATMLGDTGIISKDDSQKIIAGLKILRKKLRAGELEFAIEQEDIHLNIEYLLHQEIGPVAGKLHTARSRNDQVALDLHLYAKDRALSTIALLETLQKTLAKTARQHITTILPGYTHLQHAQPISLAHHLLAYTAMFERDTQRFRDCLKRIDISPLGSAALAGTTFPIDRENTKQSLGFSAIYENSLDAVSDRDFVLEYLHAAAVAMMHLSRLSEELILWASHEFQFISLSDTYSTGSSIMPQKKNPDMAELIRGKTGRVYGHVMALLTTLKGLPLAYNKDLQEDKECLFDTVETLQSSLKIMNGMIDTMSINIENMKTATLNDFSNATELADYLAAKGMPFRQAHEITGKLVLGNLKRGRNLQDIPLQELKEASSLIEADIYEFLDPSTAVARRNSRGGTGFDSVRQQLSRVEARLQIS